MDDYWIREWEGGRESTIHEITVGMQGACSCSFSRLRGALSNLYSCVHRPAPKLTPWHVWSCDTTLTHLDTSQLSLISIHACIRYTNGVLNTCHIMQSWCTTVHFRYAWEHLTPVRIMQPGALYIPSVTLDELGSPVYPSWSYSPHLSPPGSTIQADL